MFVPESQGKLSGTNILIFDLNIEVFADMVLINSQLE
jgi:hypothetical protein